MASQPAWRDLSQPDVIKQNKTKKNKHKCRQDKETKTTPSATDDAQAAVLETPRDRSIDLASAPKTSNAPAHVCTSCTEVSPGRWHGV